jgi:hypothetical protein
VKACTYISEFRVSVAAYSFSPSSNIHGGTLE